MKEKLGAALLCLVFAVPFGGVGVGASWVLAKMVQDGRRAQDWVRVKATVDAFGHGTVEYRYTFKGVEYHGNRLGANPIGGTDNVDSWHDDMYEMLANAKSGGQPLTVWVNPDNPTESMVDRTIRWKLAIFIVPFALGFGGVGVGAIYMFFRTLFASPANKTRGAQAKAGSGLGTLWLFAFMWNVISVPIALLVVPQAIADGQWIALLVLIFPLIGALMLWGAIAATIGAIKAAIRSRFAPAPAPVAASPAPPVNDGVFARGLIDDSRPAGAIDTADDGLPPAPDPLVAEMERMAGKRMSAEQRAELEKMGPTARAVVTRLARVLEKAKVKE